MLLGTTLLLTMQWRFSVVQAAVSIAPGPVTAGIVSPFSGRLAARIGRRGTVVAGAVLFAAAAAWPLASAGQGPAYPAVVLPSMLLWGVANALIQPSLFACADAAPQAELASASAVLAMARQLGSALGVAIFVAVLGTRPATGPAVFHRAWIVVLITAAMTACAGLATGRRLIRAPRRPRPGHLVTPCGPGRTGNAPPPPLPADRHGTGPRAGCGPSPCPVTGGDLRRGELVKENRDGQQAKRARA